MVIFPYLFFFHSRRTVNLNRRDSILFFMDRQGTADMEGCESEPKFDLSAFKSLGQVKYYTVLTILFIIISPEHLTPVGIHHPRLKHAKPNENMRTYKGLLTALKDMLYSLFFIHLKLLMF